MYLFELVFSYFLYMYTRVGGFPGGAGDTRDSGSVPGSGRSSGEGNGNPSCLENPMDRGAWQATVHEVAKGRTRLSTQVHTHTAPQEWNDTCYHMVRLLLVF